LGEDTHVWAWDDLNAAVTYAPVKVRAFMTRVRDADEESSAAGTVALSRRPLRPEEEDTMAEARAVLDEADPSETLYAIAQRRTGRAALLSSAASAGDSMYAGTSRTHAAEEEEEEEGHGQNSQAGLSAADAQDGGYTSDF
jgi:hypothetical protein